MTLPRTPSMMLCTRGFSDCWDTASRASSSGSPAFTSVASCRVSSDRSPAEIPRRNVKLRSRLASPCLTSATVTGSSWRSRSSWRTCLTVSPSTTPFCSRPAVSRAVYSKAPIVAQEEGGQGLYSVLARDAQDFFDGGFTAQHAHQAVVADRGRHGACVALELMLGGFVVNHGAHLVIDDHELVDAGASAESVAARPGPVKRGRGFVGLQAQQPAFVVAGFEGGAVIRVQRANQALRDHADEARRQQEGFDAHVTQARDRTDGGVGVQIGRAS